MNNIFIDYGSFEYHHNAWDLKIHDNESPLSISAKNANILILNYLAFNCRELRVSLITAKPKPQKKKKKKKL